jgi:hypothetical protein
MAPSFRARTGRSGLVFVLALVFLLAGMGTSFAGDKLWVGLYFAENEVPPPGAPIAPPELAQQLREVFGFHHYVFKKDQIYSLHDEWAQWFVPRRDFFIRVEPLHRDPGQPRVIDYEIYKDGFIVAKGTFQPDDGTPLFINGPDFRRGRLILVLQAK